MALVIHFITRSSLCILMYGLSLQLYRRTAMSANLQLYHIYLPVIGTLNVNYKRIKSSTHLCRRPIQSLAREERSVFRNAIKDGKI